MVYVRKTGMRTKRNYRRKSNYKSRKGLSKTEKSQVKNIAKKTVNSLAESKYFSTSGGIISLVPKPMRTTTGAAEKSEITCFGFTTGFNRSKSPPTTSNIYKYGVNPLTGELNDMIQLSLNRIFTINDPEASRQTQSIVGNSIRPSFAECKWLLERPQSQTSLDSLGGIPYTIRMIRVRPKALKGSYQKQDPGTDLFLDQYNEAYGVSSGNLTQTPNFKKLDFYLAKVNSRLYTVIEDKQFKMLPSSLHESELALVNDTNNSGNRCFTTKHNIGKELYYNEPNILSSTNQDRQFPDTGFQNEFVLFRFIGQGTPALTQGQTTNIGYADNITLSCRPVSTFKDT